MILAPIPKIIWLRWVDSHSIEGWGTHDDNTLVYCETLGWLVAESDEFYKVALSRSVDANAEPWADVMTIPKVSVVAKKILKHKLPELKNA